MVFVPLVDFRDVVLVVIAALFLASGRVAVSPNVSTNVAAALGLTADVMLAERKGRWRRRRREGARPLGDVAAEQRTIMQVV